MQSVRASSLVVCSLFAAAALSFSCSSEPEAAPTPGGGSGGSGGATSGGGGAAPAQAGTTATSGGVSGSGGSSGNAAGAATAGGAGAGGAGVSGSAGGGAAGSGGTAGTGAGKVPMCLTMNVADGVNRAANNYIECDVEEQAIDFDVTAAYDAGRDPGYDPLKTPASFTAFGTAFTGSAVQECHPYCYKGNLTLGLDFVAAQEASQRGEVLFAFPDTVAPIADATGRLSLGWIYLDGPALPGGSKLTAQMVLKNDKGVALGTGPLDVPVKNWVEFKYFPIQNGFQPADLKNVTHIGFRVTLAPAGSWQGVIYADHFQLRQ